MHWSRHCELVSPRERPTGARKLRETTLTIEIAAMKIILGVALALSFAVAARAETNTVRDFGAVGFGKADDTAAIQKAVNDFSDSSGLH